MLGRTGGVQETRGVDAHFGAPAMRTGCPAYPLARQRLAAPPRGRPGRGSRLGLGGERPQGHRCPVRARGRARFRTLVPAPCWGRSPSNHPCRKAVPRRSEAADHPFADRLAVGRSGMVEQALGTPPFRLACSLPAWDRWSVATPRGVGCSMHIPTLPRGTPSVQGGGSLRSRPPFPARHSRPAGRGTTAIRTGICVDEALHVRTVIPRTSGLLHMCGSIRAPTRPFRVLDQPPASIPSVTLKTALEP